MPRRLLSAAATGALLLGLAACGDETDGPVTTPPPSIDVAGPSDSGGDTEPSDGGGEATTEPTAEAPDIPPPDPADFAGMDEHTPEGAEQAFRYYIAVLYWGYQTGSPAELEALQGPSCSECNELLDEIKAIQDTGNYWVDVSISDKGSITSESDNYDIEVGYIYIVSEHTEQPVESGETTTVPADAWTARGGMYWIDDSWRVGGIDIAETDHEI
ncbi:DUF6318 family protein [Brachybacterium vulturis]|uniref:DUF6318 family protein n=1 Tax=Brachybacterium vulturis TaxID=2017484 RepID=UPI003734C498